MDSIPDSRETARPNDGAPTAERVMVALDGVYDPELDRSLAELGYVQSLAIDGDHVDLRLRLPTGLCSPAFAWMMVADAREAVLACDAVETTTVRLVDHVFDEAITDGVDAGRAFDAVFEDAEADVDALRRRFDEKARLGRAHDAVETLLDAGLAPGTVCGLRHDDVSIDADTATVVADGEPLTVPAEPLEAYLEKVRALDLDRGPDAPLFLDPDGRPLDPSGFELFRRRLRLASTNMDGQAHQCSLLLEARYDLDKSTNAGAPPADPAGSPT